MSSITVRPALREELPRVNALRRQVNDVHVQGRPGHFKPGFGPELEQHVYTLFDAEDCAVLVAVDGGEIAGFATVQYVHRPEGPYTLPLDYCHVHEFAVDAAHRRRGVGRALAEYIRADARAKGLPRVDLDAWCFNGGALKFYEAVGFRPYRVYFEMDT